jgi:hypothetical protein
MKVKMLSTQRGCVNNGYGNISMDYLEGGVYDAPLDDAQFWIERGFAVPEETPMAGPSEAQVPVVKETPTPKPSKNKAADIESLGAKFGKKGKGK